MEGNVTFICVNFVIKSIENEDVSSCACFDNIQFQFILNLSILQSTVLLDVAISQFFLSHSL